MLRLDQALVENGLCESREKAKRAVMAGQVKVNGQLARKPSESVKPEDQLTLVAPERFVSRGGYKLEHALNHFALDVANLTAIDLGASTGYLPCHPRDSAAERARLPDQAMVIPPSIERTAPVQNVAFIR